MTDSATIHVSIIPRPGEYYIFLAATGQADELREVLDRFADSPDLSFTSLDAEEVWRSFNQSVAIEAAASKIISEQCNG